MSCLLHNPPRLQLGVSGFEFATQVNPDPQGKGYHLGIYRK